MHVKTIVELFAVITLCHMLSAQGRGSPQRINDSQEKAVLGAVLDEIYDYGYQKEFWGFETSGPRGPVAEFPVYIDPRLNDFSSCNGCREGVIMYKYLPFGEIVRPFIIDATGAVTLVGSPEQGFQWTQPAIRTIYMDDSDVIKDKQTWLMAQFSIDLNPTKDTISRAAARQKQRVGYSRWRQTHPQK